MLLQPTSKMRRSFSIRARCYGSLRSKAFCPWSWRFRSAEQRRYGAFPSGRTNGGKRIRGGLNASTGRGAAVASARTRDSEPTVATLATSKDMVKRRQHRDDPDTGLERG
ncbi:hypothetical protein CSB45_14015 [candidate division KSB3 bacterium]|uniref:Uncharacterized protein n=1 Tax=candidate division KSB3 bacterium TaxID=2044937 RepID=A0A2G6E238_9BACT|nr:MAG: hypothetical protein CSB45_14015 [candidate division KSB3 bacterium]PIE28441.1 MAG: hypothetical protein CSA57_13660 [candidate division KSB3 bacterium]